jgi:hypothetical protein
VFIFNEIRDSLRCCKVTVLTPFNLSCTFDTVEWNILRNRLASIGIQGTALEWLSSYLIDRTQSVSVRSKVSSPTSLKYDEPQGSVLRPLLFIIYLVGIGDVFTKHCIKYMIYVDDIQFIISRIPSDINTTIEKIKA